MTPTPKPTAPKKPIPAPEPVPAVDPLDEAVAALLATLGPFGHDVIELAVKPRHGRVRIIGADRTVRTARFEPILPEVVA